MYYQRTAIDLKHVRWSSICFIPPVEADFEVGRSALGHLEGHFKKIPTYPRAQLPPHTIPWAQPAPEDAPFADAILFALHPRVLSNVLVEVGPHDAAQLAVGEP